MLYINRKKIEKTGACGIGMERVRTACKCSKLQWFFNANIPLTHVDLNKLTNNDLNWFFHFIAGVDGSEDYEKIHELVLLYIETVMLQTPTRMAMSSLVFALVVIPYNRRNLARFIQMELSK